MSLSPRRLRAAGRAALLAALLAVLLAAALAATRGWEPGGYIRTSPAWRNEL